MTKDEQNEQTPWGKVAIDGNKFAVLRSASRMSQTDLVNADKRITRHTLNKIESSGTTKVSREVIQAYADVFHCSYEDLVDPNMDAFAIIAKTRGLELVPRKEHNGENTTDQNTMKRTDTTVTPSNNKQDTSPSSEEERINAPARTKLYLEYLILKEVESLLNIGNGIPDELWRDMIDTIDMSFAAFKSR